IGCKELLRYFNRFLHRNRQFKDVKLVLVGHAFMDVPQSDNIISTGFVSEDVKWSLLSRARSLILPSVYESLSLVTLESMMMGKPVIANRKCEVLKDHINHSGAGMLYECYDEFETILRQMFEN